jgi:hypothetical protein
MRLVNETGQPVFYSISCANSADCGQIDVDGVADLPYYDNQTNVQVDFTPLAQNYFVITLDQTNTDEQVTMVVSTA